MPAPPIVELDRVGYRQQSTDILRNITWRVEHGQHWAVLGPNGSGKSTLLRIAGGYVWPTRGVMRRFGQELIDLGELRRSIGWVSADQIPLIPFAETAVETVVSGKFAQLGLKRLGELQPTDVDFATARRLLAEMQCEAMADKPFGVLSQGERQQTLVARARMVQPLAIVLDEPCAGMDPGVRERFLAWLQSLAAASPQCAMILVTHHVEEIMPAFEQTLVMLGGSIVAAGPTGGVLTSDLLAQTYRVVIKELMRSGGRLWPVWAAG